MIHIKEKSKCCGCSACVSACPIGCITIEEDEEGFVYPKVDLSACVDCGLCEKVCPIIDSPKSNEKLMEAYAAYTPNENIRASSSSGGVFSELAGYVIKNGGAVFGAEMDGVSIAEHRCCESEAELKLIRGSKYTQSNIGDAYKKTKEILSEGRMVLFSATPCQVAGLLSYLKKPYDNLYTIDIVCHGVPSAKAWRSYVRFREKHFSSEITGICFRDKKRGWKNYSLSFSLKNGKCKTIDAATDPYMIGYISNLYLRPSCYECAFKGNNHVSDITLGDYWGVEKLHPDMNDDKGVSLLIINSSKGNALLENAIGNIICEKTDFNKAIKGNRSYFSSSPQAKNRSRFLSSLDNRKRFDSLVNSFCKQKLTIRVKRKIKNIINQIGEVLCHFSKAKH